MITICCKKTSVRGFLFGWLVGGFFGGLLGRLVSWLLGWLVSWLVGCEVGWLVSDSFQYHLLEAEDRA